MRRCSTNQQTPSASTHLKAFRETQWINQTVCPCLAESLMLWKNACRCQGRGFKGEISGCAFLLLTFIAYQISREAHKSGIRVAGHQMGLWCLTRVGPWEHEGASTWRPMPGHQGLQPAGSPVVRRSTFHLYWLGKSKQTISLLSDLTSVLVLMLHV